jgi:hypothetical protein
MNKELKVIDDGLAPIIFMQQQAVSLNLQSILTIYRAFGVYR